MKPYLVQRIERPREGAFPSISIIPWYERSKNDHGIDRSDDDRRAIRALNALLPLDYMGSAEFEFGAVGEALRAIAGLRRELVTGRFEVEGAPEKDNRADRPPPLPKTKAAVWYVCRPSDVEDLKAFFIMQSDGVSNCVLKERTEIQRGLFGRVVHMGLGKRRENRSGFVHQRGLNVAWLDIGNHWFATSNPDQFKGFCATMEIPCPQA